MPSSMTGGTARARDPRVLAELDQPFEIATARLAEGEVLPGNHAGHAQMLAQQFPDEILCRGARQFAVEVEHQHRGRARGEIMLLPLFERGQTERRRIGLEMAHRVRIEGGDDRGAALFACPGNGFARHRLVAKVKAIEIAQRDDRAAQRFGQLLAMVEPPHAVRAPG